VSCIQQVSSEEFDLLIAAIDEEKRKRAEKMPTEKEALAQMFEAYIRMKEMGWNDAIYCPKDGTMFDAAFPPERVSLEVLQGHLRFTDRDTDRN
jgi:hypothetical protein